MERDTGVRSFVAGGRVNLFALVIYIPGELGRFLDGLRRELAPDYNPHAHVSVLPPRPLALDWEEASKHVAAFIEQAPYFEIGFGNVSRFPVTDVIYLEVTKGGEALERMHAALTKGPLAFKEPFVYHPHTTLAQDLPGEAVDELAECARRRWEEYRGPRTFQAGGTVFVQNTGDGCWIDLAEYRFAVPANI